MASKDGQQATGKKYKKIIPLIYVVNRVDFAKNKRKHKSRSVSSLRLLIFNDSKGYNMRHAFEIEDKTIFISRKSLYEKMQKYSQDLFCAYMDILISANSKDGTFRASYFRIQKDYGWTKSKARNFLDRLIKDETIKILHKGTARGDETLYAFKSWKAS